jgi:hypothetical protein
MTTPLHSTLKRALTIDGRDYVVTLTASSLKLTLKGKRNGIELSWAELVNGEAALAVALRASLGAFAAKDKAPSAPQLPAGDKAPSTQQLLAKDIAPSNRRSPAKKHPTEKRLAEKRLAEKRVAAKSTRRARKR